MSSLPQVDAETISIGPCGIGNLGIAPTFKLHALDARTGKRTSMITRRTLVGLIAALPALKPDVLLARRAGREIILQLQYPPPRPASGKMTAKRTKAVMADVKQAHDIIDLTPTGPRPIDIAQSFVDRYSRTKPAVISQPPPPAPVNPLISEFLKVTSLHSEGDLVPWCAAFVNFCIRRNGGAGSASAWSQSFLPPAFSVADSPQEGDLAVFTCFNPTTGQTIGLGHVAFFKRFDDERHIVVLGGNQQTAGHSSSISEKTMAVGDQWVRRHLDIGGAMTVRMRLNTYVRIS